MAITMINALLGIVVGVITSSIGGIIRFNLVYGKTPDFPFEVGILLPFYACFLMPMLGGLAGWIGSKIANKTSESKLRAFLGGFLGGILVTLIFIPYPITQ